MVHLLTNNGKREETIALRQQYVLHKM